MIEIKKADLTTLSFLLKLEKEAFKTERRFNESQIKRSLAGKRQIVYIIIFNNEKVGSVTIFNYQRMIRIYSIAILKAFQKHGFGKELINFVIKKAKQEQKECLTLEVDLKEPRLINWYESFGFKTVKIMPNYYSSGEAALKMELRLQERYKKVKNIIVIDNYQSWLTKLTNVEIVWAENFINSTTYKSEEYRIINLVSSYHYQSLGYYVSLLASARNQRAFPNVVTIEDVLDESIIASLSEDFSELMNKTFKEVESDDFKLTVLWGNALLKKYQMLAKALYKIFAAPFLNFYFVKNKNWSLKRVSLKEENIIVDDDFIMSANEFLKQKRFSNSKFKNYQYDLAILIDENDLSPPSDQVALANFKYAAEKRGFYCEFISKEDYHRLNQFDALFIRATTNVNDYTYQFSRLAYSEGLVVIDDPWSILKCANKLFLHESIEKHHLLTPLTLLVTKKTDLNTIITRLSFPFILKQPDSAASRGVFKINDEKELKRKLDELFLTSEIILAQQYLKTAFDWRVGVLNNKPLYVCKYFMAKDHWQIYHWEENYNKFVVGEVETYLVDEVPKKIIKAALQAAAIIGDGFYGVDLKERDDKIYLIEINDNPSIDSGWEDKLLKNELYKTIIDYFYEKIIITRNLKKRKTH